MKPGDGEGEEARRFDRFAEQYEAELQRGLVITGEDKAYFARERVQWVAHRLRSLAMPPPASVLDYGCGTGTAAPFLRSAFPEAQMHGVDISTASLARARREHGALGATFSTPDELPAGRPIDLVFCNGVFHHIPVHERPAVVQWIVGRLRPGGILALWENNPWNPGTRLVMRRIAFDRDAVMLSAAETTRLLRAEGLTLLGIDYRFVFPGFLRVFRPIERWLTRIPLGGQYLALARKE